MLPATGNKILDSVVNEQDTTSPKVEFELNSTYVKATAYLQNDLFVIKKGSEGKASVSPPLYATLQEKRNVLIQKGVFKLEGDKLIVTEDYATTSTSTAGCFLTGTPISGPQNWKVKGAKTTYKDWEKEQMLIK